MVKNGQIVMHRLANPNVQVVLKREIWELLPEKYKQIRILM